MAMVVKVRFKRASKLYDFDANDLDLHCGTRVVTETARGVELGECMSGVYGFDDELLAAPLKPIIRIATEQDIKTQEENEQAEKDAFDIALEKIAEHELEMKLVDVEYAFDRSKIIFYFTANGRVDFRMLVKNLAGIFKTRIELRQIGVRDEAKMLGGIGPCGRPICCRTFLSDFTPVSIKMAKEQNLSLNPTKISGLCDRLMCCLKYEQDHYEVTRKRMPRVGREIITPDGPGTINAINVLEETVRVRIAVGDSFELRQYPIDECQRPNQEQHAHSAPQEKAERPAKHEEKREEKHEEEAAPVIPEQEEQAKETAAQEAPAAEAPAAEAPAKENAAPESEAEAKAEEKAPEQAEVKAEGKTEAKAEGERPQRNDRGARPPKGPRPERGPRPENGERPQRSDRGVRPERGERPQRSDRGARPERGERPQKNERGARPENGERPQKNDRGARPERGERPQKNDRGARPENGERPQKNDRGARPESGERPQRNDRGVRPERGERPQRNDRGARPEKGERGPRPERSQNGERAPRGEKPAHEQGARPAGKAGGAAIDIREESKPQDLL